MTAGEHQSALSPSVLSRYFVARRCSSTTRSVHTSCESFSLRPHVWREVQATVAACRAMTNECSFIFVDEFQGSITLTVATPDQAIAGIASHACGVFESDFRPMWFSP